MISRQKIVHFLLFIVISISLSAVTRLVSAEEASIQSCNDCKSLLEPSLKNIPHLDYDWYFTLEANKGIFDRRGTDDYLILHYYNGTVRAYTDRPHKLAERFSVKQLVDLWHKIYLNVLPKAMVSGYLMENGRLKPVFLYAQLSRPKVVSENTLEFMIVPLDKKELPSGTVINKVVLDLTEDYQSIRASSPYYIA